MELDKIISLGHEGFSLGRKIPGEPGWLAGWLDGERKLHLVGKCVQANYEMWSRRV